MKKVSSVLLLSMLVVTTFAQSPKDKEEVNRVANAFFNSWNQHDFSDLTSYTTEDFNFVISPGILWKGRDQVQKGHEKSHQGTMKNTLFTPDPQNVSIRFITKDVAVVNLVAKMGAYYPPDGMDRGNNRGGDYKTILTMVEVKKEGKWLLTAAQGTVIDPRAEIALQQK